jgi:allantoinase
MLPTDRIAYSAITERAPLKLPDGARMAVWVIVNVEEWNPREPMPRTVLTPPAGGSPMPDIPNWAWHEYGNRVGFIRRLAYPLRYGTRRASRTSSTIRDPSSRHSCCRCGRPRSW